MVNEKVKIGLAHSLSLMIKRSLIKRVHFSFWLNCKDL